MVLRWDVVKDDSGLTLCSRSRVRQHHKMTTAPVLDVVARLLGCAGQAGDAVSARTEVKMEESDTAETSQVGMS